MQQPINEDDEEMLEKKDVRLKLRPDIHAALAALMDAEDADDAGIAAFAASILERHVRDKVHSVTVLADRFARLGISGIDRRSKG
jgi:hypothetical protein